MNHPYNIYVHSVIEMNLEEGDLRGEVLRHGDSDCWRDVDDDGLGFGVGDCDS